MLGYIYILLCLLFCNIIRGDYLEQRKVIFLDRTPVDSGINNYLFRGNEPKIQVNGTDVVAYDLLKSYLGNASLHQGQFQLPKEYYLIDIKYVYDDIDPIERADVIMEENFFKANPTYGEYHTHIILGDLDDPTLMPNKTVIERAKNLSSWQHDNLPVYIPSLYQLLYTKRAQPTVIYFHCECGCDRTGEIGGSYAMKYLGRNYKQTTAWNDIIARRPILPNHQFAIHWYCLYLALAENMPIEC